MVCPVCGKKSEYLQCPQCGFDSSRDYEKYPTLAPVGKAPAVSALKKEWWAREPDEVLQRKRPWLALIACAAALVLGIGIGAGFGGEKHGPTEPGEDVQIQMPLETTELTEKPWRENILRSDEFVSGGDVSGYSVFGSEYSRNQISSIIFLDTQADAPGSAWDVSESGDGRVLAWVIPNGELYDLYIGAEGGVSAGESCYSLFAGYNHAQQIRNMDFFHTENAQNMSWMFGYCRSLTGLDLSGFDTGNVQNMSSMFSSCDSLTSLDLSSFNTANVQDMRSMFSSCGSLTSLDLSSFDTSNVQYTTDMFRNCPAGSDWQHLLK